MLIKIANCLRRAGAAYRPGYRRCPPGWKVTHHAGDDLVAHLLFVAGLLDKTIGGLVRGVGAVPDFRPAEDRQRGTRQSAAGSLGQVELAAAILVGLIARRAEIQGRVMWLSNDNRRSCISLACLITSSG